MLPLVIALNLIGEGAYAQSSGRSFASGFFGALADQADKQIALENEIAAAKAKADIEFEHKKRMHALKVQQKEANKTSSDAEIERLDRSYPGWYEHATSRAFEQWLSTQPEATQTTFKTMQTAEQAMSLLNEHRLSLRMEPVRLLK